MSNWERGANDIKMRVEDETPCWVMDIILGGESPKKGTLYLMEFWYVGRTVSSRFRPRSSHDTHSTFSPMDPLQRLNFILPFYFPTSSLKLVYFTLLIFGLWKNHETKKTKKKWTSSALSLESSPRYIVSNLVEYTSWDLPHQFRDRHLSFISIFSMVYNGGWRLWYLSAADRPLSIAQYAHIIIPIKIAHPWWSSWGKSTVHGGNPLHI